MEEEEEEEEEEEGGGGGGGGEEEEEEEPRYSASYPTIAESYLVWHMQWNPAITTSVFATPRL